MTPYDKKYALILKADGRHDSTSFSDNLNELLVYFTRFYGDCKRHRLRPHEYRAELVSNVTGELLADIHNGEIAFSSAITYDI